MRSVHLVLSALMLLPAAAWADDPLMSGKFDQSGSGDRAVIYLGNVVVSGDREIYEAMQDIKLALDQPFSNDPKLADVVVCRITDDVGTHTKQLLICATNKVLAQNKEVLQTVMSTALGDVNAATGNGDKSKGSPTGCVSSNCYEESLSILNQSLDNTRRHYLKQQVNGASLHALLAKLPYPRQPQVVPAAASVLAPAAVTSHL